MVLRDIHEVSDLSSKFRAETEKGIQLNSLIVELESKLNVLRKKLAHQTASALKIYPVLKSSSQHLSEMRKESTSLHKKCYQIGTQLVGADYK